MMKRGLPLRALLLGMMLATALPLIALIAYNIYTDAVGIERHEAEAVSRIAGRSAQEVSRFVADTRLLLETLARQHQSRLLDAAQCKSVMTIMATVNPLFANLTVRDRADKPVCGASDRPLPSASPERESFAQAVRENRFVIGPTYVAPQIKRWVKQVRQPLHDAAGELIGIISAPIDLVRFNFTPAHPRDPSHSVTRMVDGAGTIIANSQDAESWVGRNMRGTTLWDGLIAQSENAFHATGLDGVQRIYGSAGVAGTDWRVISGVPYEPVRAATVARLQTDLGIAAALLIAAAIAAYWLARIILLPIRRIAAAAVQIASGQADVRAPVDGPREIATVAVQFNAMLDTQTRNEAELRSSEERFRSLTELSSDFYWKQDEQFRFVDRVGHKIKELSFLRALMMGKTRWELPALNMTEADWAAHRADLAAHREFRGLELHRPGPDGRSIWISTSGLPIFDRDGRFRGYSGVSTDITARKLAEQQVHALLAEAQRARVALLNLLEDQNRSMAALHESEIKLRLFIDYAPAAIAMFDRDMRCLGYSRRWIEDYQLGNQDLTGRSHYEIFPDLPQRWKEIHRRCLAGAVEKAEEDPFPRDDGSVDWVRWEVRPWHSAAGDVGGLIIFSEVITARKLAENKISQQMVELQRWFNVTLGREDRVLHLKHEVNELQKRLGEPARYLKPESDAESREGKPPPQAA